MRDQNMNTNPTDEPGRRLEHLNRVLKAILKVNQLITQSKNRGDFLQEVCECLTVTRGYFNVWIALLDDDHKLIASYESGLGEAFAPMARRLASGDLTRCALRVLDGERLLAIDNPAEVCSDCPLSTSYRRRGAMTASLKHEGQIYGILGVSVPPAYVKDAEEHKLLAELADNLGYALHNFEVENAYASAQESLRLYRDIIFACEAPMVYIDRDYRLIEVNDAYGEFFGLTPNEVTERYMPELYGEEVFVKGIKPFMDYCLAGEDIIYEFEMDYPRKGFRHVQIHFWPHRTENGEIIGLFGIGHDITERKRSEEALRESEDKYKRIFENANEGITIAQDGMFKLINSKALEISGYSHQELMSKPFIEFVHPDDQSMVMQHHIKRLKEEEIPGIYELRFVAKNGNVKWVENNGVIVRWEGKPATLSFFTDITDRKRVEKSLKDNLIFLKETQKIAKIGGWQYDVQTNVSTFTDMIFEIYGETISNPEEGIKFYHIDDRRVVSQSFENAVAKNEPYDIEARFRNAQGENLWVRTVGIPVVEDGKVVKVIGNLMDITKSKKAENQLKRSSSILNATQELAKIGGWELDRKTQNIFWTDEVYRIHDLLPDEFTSIDESVKLSMTCYNPEDQQRVVDAFRKCTEEGQEYDLELPFTTTKGRRIWVRTLAKPIMENGKIIKVIGCFMDITERKQLEEKLRQTQKMESIGNLAGGIAHDFNNILFPIIGMSEMLLEDLPPGSPEHQSVREIFKASSRGSDLVKQILAFSRQTGHQMIPVKVQQVLKEVIKLTRSAIPSNIEVSHYLQSDCGLVIADPTQLHQISMNLITNAFHAVEQTGGKISITLKKTVLEGDNLPDSSLEPGNYAMISVTDTGCGIDPNTMGKIFEPYFTTKEQGKGTGLGLAVVYGIVKEHGGDIRVYSEAGKGTTFNVYLPLAVQHAEQASSKTVEIRPTGTERILLVDDEEAIVHIEKQMLERLGYKVTTRVNSLEALEAFKVNPDAYDLILTDMTMPNMTGDQLAQKLIAIRPNIPIIICTGFSERLNPEKADAIGVKGILMKPIVKAEIAQMVRKILDEERKFQ